VIVDTSALIAILLDEPERLHFANKLGHAVSRKMSAATLLETAIVIDGNRDAILSRKLDQLLARLAITIEPVTEAQAHIARAAYRDFGKGSGHPAQLNFGDCFSYALAKDKSEPLLFKGTDFDKTDVGVAG
jgi:ribonuclease VapC